MKEKCQNFEECYKANLDLYKWEEFLDKNSKCQINSKISNIPENLSINDLRSDLLIQFIILIEFPFSARTRSE